MNYIVGIYLAYRFNEQEVYWILKYKINKLNMCDLMKEGLPKLKFLNYTLKNFMYNYLPKLLQHFNSL